MKSKNKGEAGFTIIEATIASVITLVGLLAVEMLIVQAVRVQFFARETTMANALARAQVEELKSMPRTDVRRASGGSLSSNLTNYHDATDSRFIRRWILADGPAGSQDLTVAVVSSQNSLMPSVQIRVLLP